MDAQAAGYRREPARRGPRWGVVLGTLAGAVALGALVGLLLPLPGARQTAWTLPSVTLPLLPWQRSGPVDPAAARASRELGLLPPAVAPLLDRAAPLWGLPTWPATYDDSGPRSALRRLAAPDLGPDPLAPPLRVVWQGRRHGLEARPIDPLAKLAHVPVIMYHDVVQPPKGVWFDITVAEFEADLAKIEQAGATPISLRQWWRYLTAGEALPKKPVLLTFDDGYRSVYDLIYPRLQARRWPAVFFIVTSTVGRRTQRDHLTWDQMREMHATGLFEFQIHTVSHPYLTRIPAKDMQREILDCRDTLEAELGVPAQFICYPIGDRDAEVIATCKNAGLVAGFTMEAGGSAQSPNVMEINRYASQDLATALSRATGEMTLAVPALNPPPDLTQPVVFHRRIFREGGNRIPLCWVTGGRPTTVHADFRYGVPDVARALGAPAGINGGFFQMSHVRDISNQMIGPVMSTWTTTRNEALWRETEVAEPESILPYGRFVPGSDLENARLEGRPMVLMSPSMLRFLPFNAALMNSGSTLRRIVPDLSDAFIGGAWLVRNGQALSREEIDAAATRDHHDPRRRAVFGIDRRGRPVLAASPSSQSSATIARCLAELGVVQAALLDSGFSSSLYYNGSLFVTGHSDEKPSRPVPHMVFLQRPEDPVANAVAAAVSKVDTLARGADDDRQADEMPPQARLVDVPYKRITAQDEDR
ncbi:MAG: polysaccharide deacetylase family protein [Fimbriimonadaceae bacterium]|nr:polysaccharide deacetylase family protein [Fimbriimonadaceae bacterium]